MGRNWRLSLLASILGSSLGVVVVLAVVSQPDGAESAPRVAAFAADQRDDAEQDDDAGAGPPAWARANGEGRGRTGDKAWKESWQELSPAEKAKKMSTLVKAHEQGMKEWTDCVVAARNNASERGECVKPLPPGLAKKLP